MFFSKKRQEEIISSNVETIIGAGTFIQGDIVSQGSVRVDGRYNGDIKIKGDLIVGDKGYVEGSIEAKNVSVSGELNGNVLTKGKVEINGSGKVTGDLNVKNLIIDDGAIFKGNCVMDFAPQNNAYSAEEVAK